MVPGTWRVHGTEEGQRGWCGDGASWDIGGSRLVLSAAEATRRFPNMPYTAPAAGDSRRERHSLCPPSRPDL